MSESNVEVRLDLLEIQMHEVLARLGKAARPKNWRQTIGQFVDQPEMQAVFDAAERVRELDRQEFYTHFDQQDLA